MCISPAFHKHKYSKCFNATEQRHILANSVFLNGYRILPRQLFFNECYAILYNLIQLNQGGLRHNVRCRDKKRIKKKFHPRCLPESYQEDEILQHHFCYTWSHFLNPDKDGRTKEKRLTKKIIVFFLGRTFEDSLL